MRSRQVGKQHLKQLLWRAQAYKSKQPCAASTKQGNYSSHRLDHCDLHTHYCGLPLLRFFLLFFCFLLLLLLPLLEVLLLLLLPLAAMVVVVVLAAAAAAAGSVVMPVPGLLTTVHAV